MKKFYVILIIILIGVALWFTLSPVSKTVPVVVQPSTPSTPLITYVNSSADLIAVELPFPGAVTGKIFSVIGKARGSWYFEASFPVDVLDKDGKVLAHGIAKAQSDWMTNDFVKFKADIKIPETYTGKATLVLKKDNPSGMAEKDASISFPFTIEY